MVVVVGFGVVSVFVCLTMIEEAVVVIVVVVEQIQYRHPSPCDRLHHQPCTTAPRHSRQQRPAGVVDAAG